MFGKVVNAARRRASFNGRKKEREKGKRLHSADGALEINSYDDKLSAKSNTKSCDAPTIPVFHRRGFSMPLDAFYFDNGPVCVQLPKGTSSELVRGLQSGNRSEQRHAIRVLRDTQVDVKLAFVQAGGVPALMEHLKVARPLKETLQCLVAFLQTGDATMRDLLVEHGAVSLVGRQLAMGTKSSRKWAARAVPHLVAGAPEAQEEIAKAGGVESLAAMLHSPKEKRRETAAAALAALAKDSWAVQLQVASQDRLADLSTMLPKGRAATRCMVAATLANVAATNTGFQSKVAECGGEHLLRALKEEDEALRGEALRALACITASLGGQKIILEKNGIPDLVELIELGQTRREEWVLEALMNLTSREDPTPDAVREDLIKKLLKVLLVGTASCRERSLRVLAQLSQLKSTGEWRIGEGQLIPVLVSLLVRSSGPIQEGATCVLANISDVRENRRKIYEAGAIKPLVSILGCQNRSARRWAGYTLSKLAGAEDVVLAILHEGAVESLVRVLSEGGTEDERWAIDTLSTIAEAPYLWVRGLISSTGSIEVLLSFVASGSAEMQLASLRCLANMVNGHWDSQQLVLSIGIKPLIGLLLDGDAALQHATIHVLARLSHLEACKCDISVEWQSIRQLGRLLQANELAVREDAATVLADLATIRGPAMVMQTCNVLVLLVEMLQCPGQEAIRQAARAIGNLAMQSQQIRSQVGADSEALSCLVDALDGSDFSTRAQAAHALASVMVRDPAFQSRLAQLGVVRPLVDMLHVPNTSCNVQAARALANLVEDHNANQVAVSLVGAMEQLLYLLAEGSREVRRHTAHAVANLTHHSVSNQLAVVKGQGVPSLVDLLNGDDHEAKSHAVRTFANLASSNEEAVVASRRAAITPLISIISSSHNRCREQAARALANLACSEAEQELIAKVHGIPPLVQLVEAGTSVAQEQAARALANLSCNDANLPIIVRHNGIAALVSLLRSPSGACRKQAAGALANLACNNSENCTAVVVAGGVPDLVGLLSSESEACREQAVRAVGNLACTHDNQRALIAGGAAGKLIALVRSKDEKEGCKQRAVRALANLAADNEANQLTIIREGAVAPLIQVLSRGECTFQKETKRALMLLACGTDMKAQSSLEDIHSARAEVVASVLGVRLGSDTGAFAKMHFMAEAGDNEGVPRQLLCPITHELMVDPVVAEDGHTYERSAIVEWFRNRNSSPMTNEQLKSTHVVPNVLLHAIISDFVESRREEGGM